MKSMSARDTKNGFGLLIDTARAEPVAIEKHGRAVVVVISVEEFERLQGKGTSKNRQVQAEKETRIGDESDRNGGR